MKRLSVVVQVNAVVLFELGNEMIHNAQVKVITAEEGITARGSHLEYAITHIQNGHVKRTASEIIHTDDFVLLLVQAIRQ